MKTELRIAAWMPFLFMALFLGWLVASHRSNQVLAGKVSRLQAENRIYASDLAEANAEIKYRNEIEELRIGSEDQRQ